jgi:hypothetical protein
MRFELTVRFPVHTLSRRAPSTTRPPLRIKTFLRDTSWLRYYLWAFAHGALGHPLRIKRTLMRRHISQIRGRAQQIAKQFCLWQISRPRQQPYKPRGQSVFCRETRSFCLWKSCVGRPRPIRRLGQKRRYQHPRPRLTCPC